MSTLAPINVKNFLSTLPSPPKRVAVTEDAAQGGLIVGIHADLGTHVVGAGCMAAWNGNLICWQDTLEGSPCWSITGTEEGQASTSKRLRSRWAPELILPDVFSEKVIR